MKLRQLFSGILLTIAASTVFAHSSMHESYPQDGAMMMEQPEKLQLNFENETRLVSVKMFDSANKPVALKFTPSADVNKNYEMNLPTLKPDMYRVEWMVMGSDGHKMKGNFGFMQH